MLPLQTDDICDFRSSYSILRILLSGQCCIKITEEAKLCSRILVRQIQLIFLFPVHRARSTKLLNIKARDAGVCHLKAAVPRGELGGGGQ